MRLLEGLGCRSPEYMACLREQGIKAGCEPQPPARRVTAMLLNRKPGTLRHLITGDDKWDIEIIASCLARSLLWLH